MKKLLGLVAINAVASSIIYTGANGVSITVHDIGPGPPAAPEVTTMNA